MVRMERLRMEEKMENAHSVTISKRTSLSNMHKSQHMLSNEHTNPLAAVQSLRQDLESVDRLRC